MKKLVILGGSGIGMIASSIADITKKFEVIGFLNDVIEVGNYIGKFTKIPVLGKSEDVKKYINKNYYFFIAYVGYKMEKETYIKLESLNIPQDRLATLIHPTAIAPKGYCKIGNGVLMAPFATLSTDVTLSDNCLVMAQAIVGHDTYMDKYSHVASNGVVGANVYLGKSVHVGSNSTIREKVNIGNYSLIGAGAVVLHDVPENSIVVGNPAKILREK
jgi:acetyltransferase EpsM